MPAVSYTSRGNTYTLKSIRNHKKVSSDFKLVKHLVDGIDPKEYKEYMHESIRQGYAYELLVNKERKGFFYNTLDNNGYYGRSIWIQSEIEGVVVMLWHMFNITDSHRIVFAPHSDNIKYFKSMITGPKLRMYNAAGTPVTITRQLFEEVKTKLMKYLDIR